MGKNTCEVCLAKFCTSTKYFINDKEVCSSCMKNINLTKTKEETSAKKTVKKECKKVELVPIYKVPKEKIKMDDIHDKEGQIYLVEIIRKKYGANQSRHDGVQIYTSIDLVKDAIAQVFKGKEDKKKKSKKDIDKIWQKICEYISKFENMKSKGMISKNNDLHGQYVEVYNKDADISEDKYGGFVSDYYWTEINVTIKQLNPPKIQIEEREFCKGDF